MKLNIFFQSTVSATRDKYLYYILNKMNMFTDSKIKSKNRFSGHTDSILLYAITKSRQLKAKYFIHIISRRKDHMETKRPRHITESCKWATGIQHTKAIQSFFS